MVRIFTARVQGGVIVADGIDLPEGTVVTVAATEGDGQEMGLSPEELADLDAALDAADRHEPVPSEDVLADLDRIANRSE